MAQRSKQPVALSIAGLDPSGGAGVIADIKTFTAFDWRATVAVTSLTFQNSSGVYGALHQSAEAVRNQIAPIVKEFRVVCAKTGMLPTREIVEEVARLFSEEDLPAPVVDTVMRSTTGFDLIDKGAIAALLSELFPLARLITPNIPEAEQLTGLEIADEEAMLRAAQTLREMGARAVLVKGGHLAGGDAVDVLDDEGRVSVFRQKRIEAGDVRGTGCMLSSAIAACLGKGMSLEESVSEAKRFVTQKIREVISDE
ncbi:MAG: bifunctional hydroxymethylpyrimidine kinase/phosphomethylpyrimidine kinase [Acidobacteria bacterium 13_1_20CM_3_53_8]|nr:MAG: bifunctional hydroxymethylpyrimidine kinase/phosphomethylpyrimidine kinase [Acidobacteria bacterium 13_1_20CM_3_53_8]